MAGNKIFASIMLVGVLAASVSTTAVAGDYRGHGHNNGAAIAAGVLGAVVIGSLIANSQPSYAAPQSYYEPQSQPYYQSQPQPQTYYQPQPQTYYPPQPQAYYPQQQVQPVYYVQPRQYYAPAPVVIYGNSGYRDRPYYHRNHYYRY